MQTVEPLAAVRGLGIVVDEGLREWVSNAKAYMGTEGMVDNARTKAFLEGRFEDEFMPPHNADELRATMLATDAPHRTGPPGAEGGGRRATGERRTRSWRPSSTARAGSSSTPGTRPSRASRCGRDGRFVLICLNELTHPRDRGTDLLPIG